MYEVFREGDEINFVFEYVDAGDLLSVLNKRGAFSEWSAAFVAKQVLLALCYLHEQQGVIHR